MNVFVTGAAGFVGSAVAAAFARAGHDVRGLTRNPAKRAFLAAMEVEAVVGSMQSPASYRDVAARCEVLVHAAIEYGPESWSLDRKTIETLLGTARPGAPRLIVYTSGVWVHGESRGRTMDETTPIAPPPFVARRAEHEALVRGADDGRGLRTLVVRPGCVYGGAGGLTAAWFDGALKGGAARIVGHGENHWAMVHRDDLARVYVLAAESWLGGETIDVVDGAETTVLDCARAAAGPSRPSSTRRSARWARSPSASRWTSGSTARRSAACSAGRRATAASPPARPATPAPSAPRPDVVRRAERAAAPIPPRAAAAFAGGRATDAARRAAQGACASSGSGAGRRDRRGSR